MRTSTLHSLSVIMLVFAGATAVRAQTPGPPDYDRWYSIYIGEDKAGHAHMSQATDDEGNVTTSNVMFFEVARMGMEVTIEMEQTIVESADREIIRVEFAQRLGTGTSVESAYIFEENGIVKVSTHMGEPVRTKGAHFDTPYLTPVEARTFVVSSIDKGDRELKYVTLDPSSGLKPIQTITTVEGPQKISAFGRDVVALKTKSVSSAAPSVTVTEYVDEQGIALLTELKMGAIPMRLVAATKDEALEEGDGVNPELFAPTLVKIDPPIADPRSLVAASYTLRVTEGELPDLFEGGVYAFKRIDDSSARMTVDLEDAAPAPNGDLAETRYIRSTTYANIDDSRILQLARTALRDAPDDKTGRAETLRDYVYAFVETKDLGTGFATASEVCRTASGDCTEHAVLLAALLRAERIPSRVVSGLIYIDGFAGERSVFGFHMWTQALLTVNGRPTWVDLDAVLPVGTHMDAAHIPVTTFDLSEEDLVNAMTPVVNLLGNIEIEVERLRRKDGSR